MNFRTYKKSLVKNIRTAVLNSLKDKKLIDKIYTESKEL